nr:acyltransferase [Variovorax boronicumulans]
MKTVRTAALNAESFDGIQYLRAVAALMVVVHHARHYYGDVSGWPIFGSAGVDIFFIISGFIMVHATRQLETDGGRLQAATDFLVRRLIRIVPLYWLALAFQDRYLVRSGVADISLLQDFLFLPRFNPMHGGDILPSLIVGWTLNFEMFFYVVFALAILFGQRKHLALVLMLLVLVVAGQVLDVEKSAVLRVWTSGLLGEFALGMGVYIFVNHRHWAPSATVASIGLIAGFMALALPNGAVPRLLADGIPAALIVWSGVHVGRAMPRWRLWALLGDASYSIYLVHVFTLPYCYRLFNHLHLAEPTPLNVAIALTFSTVASAAVGVVVYRLIEKPLLEKMMVMWRRRTVRAPAPVST